MGSMTDFFIDEQANEGKRLELYSPTGEKTDEYLIIRSVHSDAFIKAQQRETRAILESAANGEEREFDEVVVLASLIKDWSFDDEFNQSNVEEFLRRSPQIRNRINKLASNAEFFYGKKPSNS